jgi:hypothetical protein
MQVDGEARHDEKHFGGQHVLAAEGFVLVKDFAV